MKRLSTFCMVACLTIQVSAQSLLSFGARGGFELINPKSEQKVNSKLGFAGTFDVGYTYYWPLRSTNLGIHTGASVGYASSGIECTCEQQYTNYDYLNNEMLYTTTGVFDITLKRLYVEVPIMAALRYKGVIAQLGVKVQYTGFSNMTQDLKESLIDAFYVPYGVHVTNELISGLVPQEETHHLYKGEYPTLNLLITGRIGYEYGIGSNGSIGILAYIDYNVWNNKSYTQSNIPIIAVSPIIDAVNPVPTVMVNNAMESIVTSINPLQVGITVYYALNFNGR